MCGTLSLYEKTVPQVLAFEKERVESTHKAKNMFCFESTKHITLEILPNYSISLAGLNSAQIECSGF